MKTQPKPISFILLPTCPQSLCYSLEAPLPTFLSFSILRDTEMPPHRFGASSEQVLIELFILLLPQSHNTIKNSLSFGINLMSPLTFPLHFMTI